MNVVTSWAEGQVLYLYAAIADDARPFVIPSFSLACLALRHTDISDADWGWHRTIKPIHDNP